MLGCATPPAHRDMWMRREGEQLVVRCNISGESWRLDCVGGQWSGTIDNCSALPSGQYLTLTLYYSNEVFLSEMYYYYPCVFRQVFYVAR